MRFGKLELYSLLFLLLCTGCFVQSITPFYTASSIIAMPQIPGKWQLLKENSNKPLKTLVNAWIIRATVADNRDANGNPVESVPRSSRSHGAHSPLSGCVT